MICGYCYVTTIAKIVKFSIYLSKLIQIKDM